MANRSDYLSTIPENAKSWKNGTLYATPDGHIYKKASEGFLECKKTPKGKDKGNAIYYYGLDGKDKVSFSHNIIAELFCPKESNLQKTVRAKDNNLENDNSDNLYWHMNKEAKRKLKELERNRNSFDKLPNGFVEIPTFEEVYINKEAVVIVKGPDGRYSYLNKTLYNNKNTPVYMMSIYNYKTKKSRNIGLHVLMGLAFIEKPSEKHVNVYFKDGNGLNLNIDNLYWCTHVAPVNLRQEAQDRFFKTLPEECLVGQYNTFVSKSGRVFISKNDGYLELNPCVDKKSGDIKVHIPVDSGVTRSLKVKTLMSDLYLPMSETETKEICFKDNNRLNINLDNLYRRKRIYNVNGRGKIDYSIFNTIPEEVVETC